MSLKRIITKEEHAKLDKVLQTEYVGEGDNFTLAVEGDEDTGALRRARDHEKTARQKAEKDLRDAQTQLETLRTEREEMLKGNVPKGDVEKLEKSYQEKAKSVETKLQARIDALTGQINSSLIDSVVTKMAAEISTVPDLIAPHIRSRLRVEETDGTFTVKVVDKDGKPSALKVADLQKEIVDNKTFAPILVGSKASGGGAGGGNGGGGAGAGKIDLKGSPAQIAAALRASGRIKEG